MLVVLVVEAAVVWLIALGPESLMVLTLKVEQLEEWVVAKAIVSLITCRTTAARAEGTGLYLLVAAAVVRTQGLSLPYQMGHFGRMFVIEKAES